jgi:hypothetical protein
MNSIIIKNNFFAGAHSFRREFERSFVDPLVTHNKRFVWDYWYVPEQYRLVRTPAYLYFDKTVYGRFHSQLVQWGRENLGCHDISPPWLSYYVEGCRQELHADVPHGPWAFVFSLSPKRINFKGGETILFKDDYWSHLQYEGEKERSSFLEVIEPKFNRLIVFDPRIPHGVSEVEGVHDPLDARLVIHGWFVKPRPYVVGGLTTSQVEKVISKGLMGSQKHFDQMGPVHGTVSIRLFVAPTGKLRGWKVLTNTVRGLQDPVEQQKIFKSWLKVFFKSMQFPKARKGSAVTLPLIFE